jgi:hypothetical protein
MTGDPFADNRSLLFTVGYEMLGSAADAEDVVQETWLRWAGVDQAQVSDSRSYLVKIVTRLALNRLRTLARQRETYIGPWLPEPLLTSPDPAARKPVTGADRVAMFLVHAAKVPDFTAAPVWINAMPGARIFVAGGPGVLSLVTEGGLVTRIYAIRNPEKLRWLERPAELRR